MKGVTMMTEHTYSYMTCAWDCDSIEDITKGDELLASLAERFDLMIDGSGFGLARRDLEYYIPYLQGCAKADELDHALKELQASNQLKQFQYSFHDAENYDDED